MFSARASGLIVKTCPAKQLLCDEGVFGRGGMVVVEDMDGRKKGRKEER